MLKLIVDIYMKTLRELHEELTTSAELESLVSSVSKELRNRNVSAMHALAMYSGDDIKNLSSKIRAMMLETDTSDQRSINGERFQIFRHVLWFGEEDGNFNVDRSLHMVLVYLLQRHSPGIDDYVENIDNNDLAKRINLHVDDEGLITLKDDMELRKHALVLPKQDIMIYPHQFMRRFYSANFVYIPTALDYCKQSGHDVQFRIDPFRQSEPRYYQNIFEADHWHGPSFSLEVLRSTDRKPIRTVKFARDDDRLQLTYPLGYTVFRSDMMDIGQRQFSIEEYVPLVGPMAGFKEVPGVGEKYVIQKFAHFVYDQANENFSHVDGAVRIFMKDEYADIYETVKTGSDPEKRIGKRRKLFKVSGSLDLETVQNLLYEYFRYNPHLGEYFGTYKA